jgi:hypothetical protein
MTTMFGYANNMTHDFNKIRWKNTVSTYVIDLLPEVKGKRSLEIPERSWSGTPLSVI